jgi:hypothetical protein
LIHAFNWKKLSVAAALAFRWDGRRSQLVFQTCPGSYNAPRLIAFLNDLKRHAPRRRLVLIWDGLPAHRSGEMSAYLARQRRWLTVERLPGYAPDLNPVEVLWVSVFSRMGPWLFRSMGPLGPGPSRDRVQGWPGPGRPTAGRLYVGSAGDATPFFAGREASAKRRGPTRLGERELGAGP